MTAPMPTTPLSRQQIIDRVVVLVGGLALVLLVAGSWLPYRCPVVKNLLVGCPLHTILPSVLTATEAKLAEVGHQTIVTDQLFVDVPADQTRTQARLNFDYYLGNPKQSVYLKLQESSGYVDVATVSNPLLTGLNWPDTSTDQLSLFQRSSTYQSINDFSQNLPPANQLLVDPSAALLLGLQPTLYTSLQNTTNLNGFSYILTTYHRPTPFQDWSDYTYTIDVSKAILSGQQKIGFQFVFSPTPSQNQPFYLGTVDVDYLVSK